MRLALEAILNFVRAQETKELHSFAQTPLRQIPALQHLLDDFPNFPGAEIKSPIEGLHAVKDFVLGELRITDGRELPTPIVHQIDATILLQPAAIDGLPVKRSAGIGRRERNLNGMRIDLLRKLVGFFV